MYHLYTGGGCCMLFMLGRVLDIVFAWERATQFVGAGRINFSSRLFKKLEQVLHISLR